MRFLISLQREGKASFLPINYQYELSALIYKTLDRADSSFSRFLHEQGYLAFGRRFRLFTFSRISFDTFRIVKDAGRIEHRGQGATFEISFMVARAAEEFIKGLFLDQVLVLGDKISQVPYRVAGIEALPPPVFKEKMHYRGLSPIFLRRKRDDGGEDYLHPEEEDYGKLLIQNMISKVRAFEQVAALEMNPAEISIPDFSFKPTGKIFKNGVRIKQLTEQATMLIGYMYEFEFSAPVELQKAGYYAGFGHLGSQGFGCVGLTER
ncbi:CRISPR-associated endoribonuclease Cas6 [Cyclobacterium lianum]|uniref:CRISPR-associated endoribonuclease n=1 Tax=Cyclobacterium lianum TaxID=388280 RepID=A0A1M7NJU4_9BACT|nr:CRISPR-associated endoribonuclease Cas6 [Cyclobacterium lianum]SHN04219.1 CRISPR-associated endoribonuclease Cas6 [Cyclobacterium lianum]